jgi:drug/metabolite transporter (DMT)-like permease
MAIGGETACLGAASLWAVSVLLFRGPIREHGPRTINLAKCGLAAVLQGATVLALGQAGRLTGAPQAELAFLAASGLIGLTVGDTALFAAVSRIGVHRTLLLQTLAPLFAAALALAWRGERPTPPQMLGTILILAGVALVVAPGRRRPIADALPAPDGAVASGSGGGWDSPGIGLAALAAFGQGAGVVLAKNGMESIPPVAASFFRLAVAAVGLLLVSAALRRLDRLAGLFRAPASLVRVVPATFLGTYIALFLMMAGVALAPAGVAAVLLATSPVFSLVLEAVVDRRGITAREAAGTALAVAGVAVLVR